MLSPVQEKFKEISSDKKYLNELMILGAEKAQRSTFKTLKKVHKKVGFVVL